MIPPERAFCLAPGICASLAVPNHARSIAAIVLPTDSLPRSGPGRLHVALCRRFAAEGIPAMRIDSANSGTGAEVPRVVHKNNLLDQESVLAMDALERTTSICRHLLIGTGAGAYAAFRAALSDPRVVGIALINPQDFVGDPAWSAMVLVQRYMQRSSRSMRSWVNLVSGRADYKRILSTLSGRIISWATGRDAVAKARAQAIAVSMLTLIERGCRVMCLVTDRHSSLDHTQALFGTLRQRGFQSYTIPGADHLMRDPQQREDTITRLVTWAVSCSAIPVQASNNTVNPACAVSSKQLAEIRQA
jgi:hypothetical protein